MKRTILIISTIMLFLVATVLPVFCVTLSSGINSMVQCIAEEWPQSALTLTLTSNTDGTCKYDTSDVAYESMANTFSTTGGTTHTQEITFSCGTAYTYYVACSNGSTGDTFTAVFTIDKDPPPRRRIEVH